jgi:hypothetical protein
VTLRGKHKNISLNETEKETLKQYSTTGIHNVRLVNRAKIILALDKSQGKKKPTTKTPNT